MLATGDIITIKGIAGKWIVGRVEPKRIQLLAANPDGSPNKFNNSVGEFWIDID